MPKVPNEVIAAALKKAREWAERQARKYDEELTQAEQEEQDEAIDAATDAIRRAVSGYDPSRGDFQPWADAHVRLEVRSRLKRLRKDRAKRPPVWQFPEDGEGECEPVGPAPASPAEEACPAILYELPADLREPMRLVFYEGCTQAEAAARLGTTRQRLRTMLERGKGLLEHRVRPDGE